MAYGLKYQIPFLSSKNETFLINLSLKDYTGTITTIEGAPDPFLVAWESGDNDIINPIRASECTINFYNNGSTPLTAFYSEDDEAWKIEFYRQTGNKLLWSGFLVQDDCRETFQDPPHIVSLKGTDNLALLKDVPFNEAWFAEPLLDKTNILDKYSLFDFIKYSLLKTGLQLPLNIYSNIYENSMPDRADDTANDMFRQTHLFSGMFLNDDGTWANCYEILEKILFPLNATLQQAGGAWQIVRWPELRSFANNAIPGSAYDANFDILSAVTLAPNAVVAHGSAMEFINADATKSILRPYKNVKFTFNYQQPRELIKNLNLQQEGNLIRPAYPDGDGNTVREYELLYWYNGNITDAPSEIFLRVISTPVPGSVDEIEKERYAVIKGGDYGALYLRSDIFPITQNDRVNISLQFRDTDHRNTNDDFLFVFGADLVGTPTYYGIMYNVIHRFDGQWFEGGVYRYSASNDQDMHDWTSIDIESHGCPIDGNFFMILPQINNSGNETHYKDFSVEYMPYINETARIIGHYHKQEIAANPKNKLIEEIEIDDSPKPALQGALFTHELTDDEYLTLTKSWHRSGITETRRLGEITTMEREQIQSTPRAIIEGTIDYMNPLISIMNVMQIDTLPGLNFIFGVTEINFMEGQFKATLWEIHSGETDATMAYTFEYIYKIS
jgi:hypothetical protein